MQIGVALAKLYYQSFTN
ncbi:UNVERIFIED_CONTAM: hypothetical protein GTU68_005731 [Idotea baltica]|nr:hypothetical protein [Idotea baltica]